MRVVDEYQQYVNTAIEKYVNTGEEKRYWLVNSIGNLPVERVLDVGCGAGYDLLQFIEKKNANGFGVDVAEKVGEVGRNFFETTDYADKVSFICSRGENLPFADKSFDVVLCMVALPYMNNRQTIAEVARVLQPNGVFLLKIHAPKFYFQMFKDRLKNGEIKALVYPIIALLTGIWYWITGNQLQGGILQGKEMFQTEKLISRELKTQGLKIKDYLPSNNPQTPAFLITKI